MDHGEAARQFADRFHRLYLRYYARQDPRAHRPSRESLAVLEHLARTGPLTVAEAARHFDRSQSATSELLDRLEERGLVARAADERDRRRHLVWLTDEGLDLWRSASFVLSLEQLESAFERLSEAQRQAVVRSLDPLLD